MNTVAYPAVPVGHPDYKWTTGADVQATWRRFGWKPPSEGRVLPTINEEPKVFSPQIIYRRNK
jgi:hypothetical protein